MRVQTLISGSFATGVTNGSTVFVEPIQRTGTTIIQFDGPTLGSGYMTLQGRMSSDLSWFNITNDALGAVQLVATMPQFRVVVNNGSGGSSTFNAVIGG